MSRLGFQQPWINLEMSCVSSIQYSVLVNGKPGQTFTPSRGLRQGDPLSPYLFLLCMKGFSTMVNQAELKGDIQSENVARGTSITHLLFVDDCVLFCSATRQEWMKLQNILTAYEKGCRQV